MGTEGPSSEDKKQLATPQERRRLARFLRELRERGRRGPTLAAYKDDWQSIAEWFRGTNGSPFDLSELSRMDVAECIQHFVRSYAPATVSRRICFLKAYAGEAHRRHEISDDAWRNIEKIRAVRTQSRAPRGLTAEEAREALRRVDKTGSPRDQAILYTFLWTGLRVGELAGLERRDIELSERKGSIHVRAGVGKGGKERVVPLPKTVRGFLDAYLSARKDDDPALFVGQRGPLTTKGLRETVSYYAGVPPHRLRHTFAYQYLRDNENDLVALADILGHESLNTTRNYTRRRMEDLEEGVENVRYEKRERHSK